MLYSGGQFSIRQVVLRRNAECVRNPIKKGEHCGDVDSFRDLLFFPPCVSKFLNVLGGRSVGCVGDQLDVIE
jgi:hypothetical protein